MHLRLAVRSCAVFVIASSIGAGTSYGHTPLALPDGCLNAADASASLQDRGSCGVAQQSIEHHPDVQALISAMSLDDVDIVFLECTRFGFSANSSRSGGKFRGIITYPSQPKGSINPQVAPLAHELGHIVQLKQAGGLAKLKQLLPSVERELGADFLAGYALRRMLTNQNVTDFSTSRDLPGQYATSTDDHGAPLLRTNAFRRGFYYSDRQPQSDIYSLHLLFQAKIITQLIDPALQ